ncbi:DUF1206 domain-containing protein [Streptomyces sp. NPDC001941]|uniref:DUF1206 domain-containing protein n=1 Tax=Streptomyces sp. NPDC001941 TaxID=3154659 RepID=UPI0033232F82
MEVAGRWGFAARGVIYLLVGVLALRIAFGGGGEQADRGGALAEVAQKPLGVVMLWLIGIGFAGMALWRLSEAVFGSKTGKRLMSGGRAVFYGFVAYSVLAFATGDEGSNSGSSDRQSRDITAKALGLPAGQWLVGIAGLVVAGIGVAIAVRAIMRKYHKHLKLGEMSKKARRFTDVTGVGGGTARGLIAVAAGIFVVRAAVKFKPEEAKGMDDTLRSFADTPAGPWLLVAVAVGLALFGLFSFAMARWRHV